MLDEEYYINPDGEVYDISQLDNSTVTGMKYKINKIRPFVIRELMNRKFREPRGVKYLEQALSNDWVYKDVRFKKLGKTVKAWVRKEEDKSYKKMDPMDVFTEGLNI